MQQMMQASIVSTPAQAATPMAGGAIAGALAGAITAALSPLLAVLSGTSAWSTLNGLGSLVLGSAVLAGNSVHVGAVVVGALLLIALATALGALFGLVFERLKLTTDFGLAIYGGLGYGMLVYLVAYWGVLGGVPFAAAAVLLPVLLLTTATGLFYTLLCPAPYPG